jgi:hypothetical protein
VHALERVLIKEYVDQKGAVTPVLPVSLEKPFERYTYFTEALRWDSVFKTVEFQEVSAQVQWPSGRNIRRLSASFLSSGILKP